MIKDALAHAIGDLRAARGAIPALAVMILAVASVIGAPAVVGYLLEYARAVACGHGQELPRWRDVFASSLRRGWLLTAIAAVAGLLVSVLLLVLDIGLHLAVAAFSGTWSMGSPAVGVSLRVLRAALTAVWSMALCVAAVRLWVGKNSFEVTNLRALLSVRRLDKRVFIAWGGLVALPALLRWGDTGLRRVLGGDPGFGWALSYYMGIALAATGALVAWLIAAHLLGQWARDMVLERAAWSGGASMAGRKGSDGPGRDASARSV